MKTEYYIGTSEVSKEVYDTVQMYKESNLLLTYENEKYKKALEIIKKFGLEIHITELNAFVTSKTIKGIFNARIYITDKKDEIELLKSLKEILK